MAKDVLEVLNSQLDNLCVETPEDQAHFDSLEDATWRIAEPIAADVEYDEAMEKIHEVGFCNHERLIRAEERRAAALAACRGLA